MSKVGAGAAARRSGLAANGEQLALIAGVDAVDGVVDLALFDAGACALDFGGAVQVVSLRV